MCEPYENWRTRITFDCLSVVDFVVPKVARCLFPRDRVLLISSVVAETEGDWRVVLLKPYEQLEVIALEPTEPRFAGDIADVAVFVEGFGHCCGDRRPERAAARDLILDRTLTLTLRDTRLRQAAQSQSTSKRKK